MNTNQDANEEVNGEGGEIQDQVNTGESTHNQEIINDANKVVEELNQVPSVRLQDFPQ